MANPTLLGQEIRQLAYYQVRPEGLDKSLAAIRKFVDYVRANEPGTLRYEVWQEKKDPTRFVHIFVFQDAEADRTHSESKAVEELSGVLYPQCLAPVDFVDYKLVVVKRIAATIALGRETGPLLDDSASWD